MFIFRREKKNIIFLASFRDCFYVSSRECIPTAGRGLCAQEKVSEINEIFSFAGRVEIYEWRYMSKSLRERRAKTWSLWCASIVLMNCMRGLVFVIRRISPSANKISGRVNDLFLSAIYRLCVHWPFITATGHTV